jgi:hypothetical protein
LKCKEKYFEMWISPDEMIIPHHILKYYLLNIITGLLKTVIIIILYVCVLAMLRIKPRALHKLSKCCTSELDPQPWMYCVPKIIEG